VSAIRQIRVVTQGLVLAAATCAFLGAPARAESGDACRFVTIGSGVVRAVTEAGIALEDGRIVRLAGVELSAGPLPLASGTVLILKRLATVAEADRYGRLNAHVFIGESWVQSDAVGQGLARVSARFGDSTCARLLKAKEQTARAAKLGLWAEPVYVIGKAENPAGVLGIRGEFGLVEGKVLSVRESGGTIYVNFGRRWSEDFTVTIAKRNERVFSAAGLEPKSLAGQRVRIRGWIEERGGPWVEAARPEQIEVLGQ